MSSLSLPRRLTSILALTAILTLLPACDSSDPISDPNVVAGTYTLAELRYVPANASLGAINLLGTRFTGNVTVELLSGGDYTIRYQPVGGRDQLLTGTFRVTEDEVRFTGREADAAEYRRFLLDQTFSLDRQDNALVGAISRVVNTARYPDLYTGVGEVQGEVRLRLQR